MKPKPRAVWQSVGLAASEAKARDRVLEAAGKACPAMKRADILRAALRSGLRAISQAPESAQDVRPLS